MAGRVRGLNGRGSQAPGTSPEYGTGTDSRPSSTGQAPTPRPPSTGQAPTPGPRVRDRHRLQALEYGTGTDCGPRVRDRHRPAYRPALYTGTIMPLSTAPVTPRIAARRPARLDEVLDLPFLRAIAEPSRARLVSCLLKCGRPCSVTEIADCCELDFSTVARHLGLLARSGVLTAEKRGRTMWYDANASGLARRFRELADAIDELEPSDGRCDPGDCGCGADA